MLSLLTVSPIETGQGEGAVSSKSKTPEQGEDTKVGTENLLLGKMECNSKSEAKKHKKKNREKKGKHENAEGSKNSKTGSIKEVFPDHDEDRISTRLPTTGCEVTKEVGNETTKKERKHESISFENREQKTDGEKMEEINADKNEAGMRKETTSTSSGVAEKSDRHIKKKKKKKQKHESDVSVKNTEKVTDYEKMDVDNNENGIEKDVGTSGCAVTEKSGHKEKKRQHENDVSVEDVEQKTDSVKVEISVEKDDSATSRDMPTKGIEMTGESETTSSFSITEKSGHKKQKKKRKHESDVSVENLEQKPDGEKMEKVDVDKNESELRKAMPMTSYKESDHHKKKKKEKKRKHESDISVENMEQRNDGVKIQIASKDMSTKSMEVTKGSDSRTKNEKKHECDLSVDNVEQKTDSEEMQKVDVDENEYETRKVMSKSSCEVAEESEHHRKKKKRRKHESDVSVENGEQKTDSAKIEIASRDMSTKSIDVTEQSVNRTKNEKEKKHKSDVSVENVEQNTDCEEMQQIDVDKKGNEMRKVMSTSSCEVTEESEHHKKKKKEKKRKHESDVSVKNIEQGTDLVKVEKVNLNEKGIRKDMPTTSCEDTNDSIRTKKKKKKKLEHKSDSLVQNVECKTDIEEIEVTVEMPKSKFEVTDDPGHKKKKKKKDKKRKLEIDSSYDNAEENTDAEIKDVIAEKNVGMSKDMESNCEHTEDSGRKKRKKEKRLMYENDFSVENLEQESDGKKMEIGVHVTEADHGEKENKHEKTSNTFGNSEKSDLTESKNDDDKVGGNQWASAEFASVEKKEKFLRLMGAFKPSSKPQEKSNYSAMAMNKREEKAFVNSLEAQYFQSKQMGKEKGVGLGYH